LSIEKRRGQARIFNDFHYFVRADAHASGISGGRSTGVIHSLSLAAAFADTICVRPSSPCVRTVLITNSNLNVPTKVPALPAPPFAAATAS
jgi:hypothetical protein